MPSNQWLVFDAAEVADNNDNDNNTAVEDTAVSAAAATIAAAACTMASPGNPAASSDSGNGTSAPELHHTPVASASGVRPTAVATPGEPGIRDIIGGDTANAISDMRLVLAGAGGVGREVLRCWALMGAGGCGQGLTLIHISAQPKSLLSLKATPKKPHKYS